MPPAYRKLAERKRLRMRSRRRSSSREENPVVIIDQSADITDQLSSPIASAATSSEGSVNDFCVASVSISRASIPYAPDICMSSISSDLIQSHIVSKSKQPSPLIESIESISCRSPPDIESPFIELIESTSYRNPPDIESIPINAPPNIESALVESTPYSITMQTPPDVDNPIQISPNGGSSGHGSGFAFDDILPLNVRSSPVQYRVSSRSKKWPARFIEIDPVIPVRRPRRINIHPPESARASGESAVARTFEETVIDLNTFCEVPHVVPDQLFLKAETTLPLLFGPMNQSCTFCQALFFAEERNTNSEFTLCCMNGTVTVENSLNTTPTLERLFDGDHELHRHFMDNIIYYNNSLAMASIGAKFHKFAGGGPPIIKVNGIFMHNTSSLKPNPGDPPRYAQLYVVDPAVAVQERRSASNNRCDERLLSALSCELFVFNPYVTAFRSLLSIANDCNEICCLRLVLKKDASVDARTHNLPSTNDVAIVFKATDGSPQFDQDIVVQCHSGERIRVKEINSLCDPLCFPLLYPKGGYGWDPTLRITSGTFNRVRKSLTQRRFFAFLLCIRSGSVLHRAGQLMQLYIVMAYLKVEKAQLDYLRHNQSRLKSEKYNVLRNFLRYNGDQNVQVGRQVILPSAFIGSPRNLHQLYLDSMSLVQRYGRPDYFITFTCNPEWPEIKQNLGPNQTAYNRPDLVARVFQSKVTKFLKFIIRKKFFGPVLAYTAVIEYQKRGLPHLHLLLIVSNVNKPVTSDIVDRFVSAEIPPRDKFPKLHDLVLKFQIHGPCSESRCIEDGKCTRRFPKAFAVETVIDRDTYPTYRRRDMDPVEYKGRFINNSYVVPYSPILLAMFQGHINVEVCSSISKGVKYLFKYFFKGIDGASLAITNDSTVANVDEIQAFQDARYVTAPEACWRLFQFPMHHCSHSVVRLPVHLPEEHIVLFDQDITIDNLTGRPASSMLLAFFSLCNNDTFACTLLYSEVPLHYTWNTTNRRWVRRVMNSTCVIARIHNVGPSELERFALRLLLLHVRGPRSFRDLLKDSECIVHNSFRESAIANKLMDNENEWILCLQNACNTGTPRSLRLLFATICSLCSPPSASQLWESFKESFIEDFVHQGYDPSAAEQMGLREVDQIYASNTNASTLSELLGFAIDYNMLLPNLSTQTLRDSKAISESHIQQLNNEQKHSFNCIFDSVNNVRALDRLFFLDGPGGSGKTFLYTTIIHTLISRGMEYIAVSWTGIAASLLHGGRTAHITFNLPLIITETTSLKANTGSNLHRQIVNARVLIWDEITLVPKHALRAVEALFRQVRVSNLPFGGVTVVTGGDWRQCLPILKYAPHRSAILENCVKSFALWDDFILLRLTTNMRANGDENFCRWLIEIGEGKLGHHVALPNTLTCSEEEMFEFLYGHEHSIMDASSCSMTAILCPRNEDADTLNTRILDSMTGTLVTYTSVDSFYNKTPEDEAFYTTEYLNSLQPHGFPSHILRLKQGCVVMLIRNLSVERGLTNGTKLIVKKLSTHVIETNIVKEGRILPQPVFIHRIDFVSLDLGDCLQYKRHQFPIKLSYAMTINKSQGQTLNKVVLYLKSDIFAHGQLYVALSRVRSSDCIRICYPSDVRKDVIQNVVYREIFDDA